MAAAITMNQPIAGSGAAVMALVVTFALGRSLQEHSSVKCLMTFVGEQGRIVAHFDQGHFNQSLQITWTDGR